ncbi:alpha/beta fold hydrolase [Bacillus sp. Marseille-Q1617]|uniref:alpha/beta fold hydrolase n=1 Tax=Bacillus sp. Marseille-Q1617 TaxID=2736887 RepID=UPI00158B6E5B|nr:alpha/beta fold hydrolase [Bacillus sp. Marseille-Q1617]
MMGLTNGEFTVQLNGINHWVKIEGSENETTPIVIIHGGPGGNHYVFERTAGHSLSKTRTIVYYEQRGCGRTEMPESENDYTIKLLIQDFVELKKWLGAEKVDLLGYSFGGELALEIAYALPDEINQLILSAPSLIDTDIQKMIQITGFLTVADKHLYRQISKLQQEGLSIDALYNRVWCLVDSSTVDLLLFENQEAARKNRVMWQESELTNTGLMMKSLQNNPSKIPLIFRLEEIHHRTLIITGVFDRNTGLPISKIIHKNLRNSSLVLFEKSAHFPDLEEKEGFVKRINEFLRAKLT